MRVRYFPHTHVSDALADDLKHLFDEVAVIVASPDDPVPGGLTALGPSPEEARKLSALLADWRRFSGLHQEGVATYAMGLGRRVDPLDELLTSQIKSELLRQVEGGPAQDEGADAQTAARALLSLAAEYDLRSRELQRDLAEIDKMQQDLLDALKGDVPELTESPCLSETSGDVKMLKRLSAWSTLFVGEEGPCRDRVFVTDSREAIELVEEYGCSLEEVGVLRQGRLSGEILEKLLAGESLGSAVCVGDVTGDEPVTVRIFITGSEHPYNVFNGFIQGAGVSSVEYQGEDVEIKGNVLFVLLEQVSPG
ncbi:hypothetical protein DSLASN_22210 [Desulfoluna limicola]|uniref:Uncharacterized protein n=1 Tax=Desulfoluna limicola TaxID=2810562 RepID=A0ABN6F259_9BACT|nr:tRNA-dependent cyclodipeptide synthase [Desulfoluna limicola]BCS96589.1 hypothetical protein DSLASN_22210 [Desulfoluna limicola]